MDPSDISINPTSKDKQLDMKQFHGNLIKKFKQFNKKFEKRLEFIDQQTKFHSNNIELKYPVLEEWVNQLRNQNQILLEIDENHTANDDHIENLESDLKNLLEVVKRAREQNRWNADNLEFRVISIEDIFGCRGGIRCEITEE